MPAPRIVVCRNEVDAGHEYHCDALAACFPDATEVDYARGERPALDDVDGVVLTGSTAGVYERDEYDWMDDQMALVRDLVDREVPTLAVCFGHQLANAALGGTVEAVDTTAGLVAADLDEDALFEGVSPIVPAVHGDEVTESGDGMAVIGTADYYDAFATRHEAAPLWTTQFHPELTAAHRPRIERAYGWTGDGYTFADVNATRVYENFTRLVADAEY
jgi:GMP synthase (glutamine-hydrolysing)